MATSEIYRWHRRGYRVLAVVSALGNETLALQNVAKRCARNPAQNILPRLLRLGEYRSAALLALRLIDMGLSCCPTDPHEIGLVASGAPTDAGLVTANEAVVNDLLVQYDVVAVPGFVAETTAGKTVTLGSGGSDLTAVFLAGVLGAEELRLLKDVDGIYPNPVGAREAPGTDFFDRLHWDDLHALASSPVQTKALAASQHFDQPIRVARCDSLGGSLIGSIESRLRADDTRPALKLGLLGHGTIGSGVFDRLSAYGDKFVQGPILVREPSGHGQKDGENQSFTADVERIWRFRPDIVVELIGGTDTALTHIHKALSEGIDVVSANKTLIARHGEKLMDVAARNDCSLRYSAAVGGGVPLLEAIDRLSGVAPLVRIEGILNGTTNYVLDRMVEGISMKNAISDAQQKGFAEADPSADIDGRDAAEKLVIAAFHAWGIWLDPNDIETDLLASVDAANISAAARNGNLIKQVARCWKEGKQFRAEVRLLSLPRDHFLAGARGEYNRILLVGEDNCVTKLSGKGAGKVPTSEAVLADLLDIWRARQIP